MKVEDARVQQVDITASVPTPCCNAGAYDVNAGPSWRCTDCAEKVPVVHETFVAVSTLLSYEFAESVWAEHFRSTESGMVDAQRDGIAKALGKLGVE